MFPLWSIWDVFWAFTKCLNAFILDKKNLTILMMKLWFDDNCYDPFIDSMSH